METRFKDRNTTDAEKRVAFQRLVGNDMVNAFKTAFMAAHHELNNDAPTLLEQVVGTISTKQLAGALVGQMLHEHDTAGRRFYYGPHSTTFKGRADREEPLPGLFEAWDRFKGPLWDDEFLYLLSEIKGNFDADTFRHDFAEALVNALYWRNKIKPSKGGLEDIVDELLADPPTATKATAQQATIAPHRAARVNVLK